MRGFIESLSLFKKAIFERFKVEAILLCLAIFFTIISAVLFFKASISKKINLSGDLAIEETKHATRTGGKIFVQIAGAVIKPDVYETTVGARIKDILLMAGGLSDSADRDYFFRNFNLSRILSDQDKLYIPTIQDVISGYYQSLTKGANYNEPGNPVSEQNKISINQSTGAELESLPGIGPSLSLKIINSRPYKSLEELLERKIISKNLFEKIKSSISL